MKLKHAKAILQEPRVIEALRVVAEAGAEETVEEKLDDIEEKIDELLDDEKEEN